MAGMFSVGWRAGLDWAGSAALGFVFRRLYSGVTVAGAYGRQDTSTETVKILIQNGTKRLQNAYKTVKILVQNGTKHLSNDYK